MNFPSSFAVCMLPLSRRYVAELQALKAVLLAAAAEQEALEKRVAEVRGRSRLLRRPAPHCAAAQRIAVCACCCPAAVSQPN